MAIDQKIFSGGMNTDDSNEIIASPQHKLAFNGRFRGHEGANLRFENIVGNRLINNSAIPDGANECIGYFYDQLKQRIFYFNYNSAGNHGIYVLNTLDETFTTILVVGAFTDGDILGFNLDVAIHSVNIIYGDPIDGDILTFVDCLKRPTAFNIDEFIANQISVIKKRSFINVAKAPPVMPAQVTYENDTTISINNLKNSLFQFTYTHVDVNNVETVVTTASIVPLPDQPFETDIDADESKNSRISVYLETGDVNIAKVKLYGRQTKNGATTDWFLIDTLVKTELSIPSNQVYRFLFLNDSLYPFADIEFTSTLQFYVPPQANTQELLNGNVLVYGGITEGLDLIKPTLTSISANTLMPRNYFNGALFFAYQNLANQITIVLTGAGNNNGSGNPITLPIINGTFYVNAIRASDGLDATIEYGNVTLLSSIPSIFTQIIASAFIKGYTLITQTDNTIVLQYGSAVLFQSSGVVREPGSTFGTKETSFVYAPRCNYAFGLEYQDENGITNGVITDIQYNVKTVDYDELGGKTLVPLISLLVYNRPPLWAKTWQIVRSRNQTYNKRLYWITLASLTEFSGLDQKLYSYFDIQNINDYNKAIKSTAGVVGYDFTPGDRITFMYGIEFNGDKTAITDCDFEIVGTTTSVQLANGRTKVGNYIQINEPNALPKDGNGQLTYQNYEIFIYNYTQHATSETQTYFEFGKKYGIGNPGTNLAYHFGDPQSQTPDLATPAKIETADGDFFLRTRDVPIGNQYEQECTGFHVTTSWTTLARVVPDAPITTPNYTIQSAVNGLAYPEFNMYPTYANNDYLLYNTSGADLIIHLVGSSAENNDVLLTDFRVVAKVNHSDGVTTDLVVLYQTEKVNQIGINNDFAFDKYVTVPAGAKVWPLMFQSTSHFVFGTFTLYMTVLKNKSISIIEDSFSDVYAIRTNSNSRPLVIDKDAKQTYYPTLIRWGLAYQPGTNLNQMNRFYYNNSDESDRSKGDIERFITEDRLLYQYQKRAVGNYGIYSKFIQDSNGQNTLTTTDQILTKTNIQYLVGEYGVGDYPECVVRSKSSHYFIDPVRGYVVRRSQNGLTPISEIYKGQYLIRSLLTPYNKTFITAAGGKAKILGYYDFFEEQYHCILQGGTNGSDAIGDYNFSFNEKRNSFCNFYEWYPERVLCAEDRTFSFKAGQIWKHDNTDHYTNWFGVQYFPSITLVFNDKENIKKKYMAIGYQSNGIWFAPTNGDINTSMINPQTNLPQVSSLLPVDFEINENIRYAAFLRDANSMANSQMALVEGDFLGGNWIEIKLQYNYDTPVWLLLPYINYIISQRNY